MPTCTHGATVTDSWKHFVVVDCEVVVRAENCFGSATVAWAEWTDVLAAVPTADCVVLCAIVKIRSKFRNANCGKCIYMCNFVDPSVRLHSMPAYKKPL